TANMQNVAVFAEDKGSGMKIYAQHVEDETASTANFSKESIFFANPVKAEILIKSNVPIYAVKIFNVLGQQLFNGDYNGENEIKINTQHWNSGIYFMNLSGSEESVYGIKLVKK